MKKRDGIILIMISVMVLTLSGCGGHTSKDSIGEVKDEKTSRDTIELTLENVETYLNIRAAVYCSGLSKQCSGTSFKMYDTINCKVAISGASSNFIYNNVEVIIRVAGTYSTFSDSALRGNMKSFDETIGIKCNVGGDGDGSTSFKADRIHGYTYDNNIKAGYEIISVSGSVEKS